MKRINRLLIDSSSVLMACLFAAKGQENSFISEFEGKEDIVPSAKDGYEIFLGSLENTMKDLNFVPSRIVFVKDGKGSRELRQQVLTTYKKRPAKNPAFLEQFNEMQARAEEMLWSYGALSVVKERFEADDVIAAMWEEGDVIWSKDGDLQAAGDWYYDGQLNPNETYGIGKKHIVVYKSLVGDPSDKIPGAKGFGKKAFTDMIAKYDDDVCDDILEMLNNKTLKDLDEYVEDFKPFGKVIESEAQVYKSFYCARFHHPGWDLDWQCRFPETNGDLNRWERTETLMGSDTLNMLEIEHRLSKSRGFIGLDIETWEDAESLEWGEANKSKTAKKPKLDTYGSHMTGLSITCGENNEHVYYFPVDHKDTDNLTLDQLTDILNLIPDNIDVLVHNALFELPIVRSHCELRFDRGWLPNVLDTQIERSYENENKSPKLKDCTKEIMKYDQTSYDTVTTKVEILCDEDGEGQYSYTKHRMNELTGEEVVSYGADDAVVTCSLHTYFRAVMDYEGSSDAFDQCEQWSAYMFSEAFLNGIRFDMNRLAELTEVNRKKTEENKKLVDSFLLNIEGFPGTEYVPIEKTSSPELKRAFKTYSGISLKTRMRALPKLGALMGKTHEEFGNAVAEGDVDRINEMVLEVFEPAPVLNMGSPNQKAALLYDFMKLPIRLYGKLSDTMRAEGRAKGNPKADEAAIQMAIIYDADKEQKKLLEALLSGVELGTESSLFLKPYAKMPNPKDGMVHYGTGHSKTTSRRNAANGPNTSQVSKKSPIREVYDTLDDDHVWVSFDWSGQELVITAFRSGCRSMRKCYPLDGSKGLDVHSKVAEEIAILQGIDIDYETINTARKDDDHPKNKLAKELRNRKSKPCVFGGIYGQQKQGLALKLMVTEDEAQGIMGARDKAFPGVAKWKEERKDYHQKNGYAETLLGARKHLQLNGSWKDESVLRSAVNFEVQSCAAEQMKIVVSKCWQRGVTNRYPDVNFLLPVHDETNWSIKLDTYTLKAIEEIHGIMMEPYGGIDLPLKSSIEIGPNFGQLTEIGEEFDEKRILEVIEDLV